MLFFSFMGVRGKCVSSVQRTPLYLCSKAQSLLLSQWILHYFFLFSPLCGQSSPLPSLLTQWFSAGNNFASLSRQCLETHAIVTVASTGIQHAEIMDTAKHPTTHRTFHPYPHHTCTQYSVPWPKIVSKLIDPVASRRICSRFVPSILPSVLLSFLPSSLLPYVLPSLHFSSLTHIRTQLHFKHIPTSLFIPL